MMKCKVSFKEVKSSYGEENIYSISYCEAQSLFNYRNPFAYTASKTYGWRCDYYDIDGLCFSTGYSTIGKRVPYELVKKYEREAGLINVRTHYTQTREALNELIAKFIKELKEASK